MILNPIQKKSTFQLENKALVFRKPIYSKSPISRTFTDHKPTFSAGLIKDFIPTSLTVPHNNQINKLNQIKPVNVLNMKSIQINPNNKINVSSSQVINNQMPNKVPILTPKISNSSIITNNNIINNQPVLTNNLKPVSVINMNNNANNINNYKIGSQISSNNYALYNPNQNFINPSVNQNAITNVSKIIPNPNQNTPINIVNPISNPIPFAKSNSFNNIINPNPIPISNPTTPVNQNQVIVKPISNPINPVQNNNQNIQSNIPTIIAKPVQNNNQNIQSNIPTIIAKPVQNINQNIQSNIPTIIAKPVQNINQNIQSNIPTIIAKPVQNINQNIPIMAPTTVPNTIQKVISIPNQNQNTISVTNTITNVLTSPNSFLIPSEKLNLNEFELLGEIGKGSFGKIYKVRWKVNQKLFALKNELVDDMEGINTRLSRGKAMRDFVQSTGCTGVVNIYGYHLIRQGNEYHYFELMDLCDTDFEKQIKMRANYLSYFTEAELNNIMKQLISTLSFLQKRHITHRDIKPQNILIANGQYKLCDFGDIRVMQRDGLVVQRIRGSELYMSPILFNGLRQGVQTIQHNTYKSDVFSLGMCLFYAACLSFNGPVEIREVVNMNIKQQILNKYLGTRYSQKFIKFLYLMLVTNENDRPDFVLLEDAMLKYGL
jgi:hypothetical protein